MRCRKVSPEEWDREPTSLAQDMRSGRYGDANALIRIAQELRRAADAADQRYLNFLHALDLSDLWRPMHNGTFLQFLRAFGFPDPARYDRYLRMRDVVPEDVQQTIGLEAALQSVRLEPHEGREECITLMFRNSTNTGVPLSRRRAEQIVSQYKAPNPRVDKQAERIRALQEECARLRDLVRTLEREKADLTKRLEQCEGRSGKKKSSPKNRGTRPSARGS